MNKYEKYIFEIANGGGPTIDLYTDVLASFIEIGKIIIEFGFSNDQLISYWNQFGNAFIGDTLQSHVIRKPYGYSGDYEIIDKIYTSWITPNPLLNKWDLFFQSQKAPQAVRARKEYFKKFIKNKLSGSIKNKKLEVLDVGCGSSRDIYELLCEIDEKNIDFTCIDIDEKAIIYSRELCKNYLSRINFIHKNILRFNDEKKYDVIWSAGLFDYLDNRTFVILLKKMISLMNDESEIVIGNFSPTNPTRYYMECGYWFLNYRDSEELLKLSNQTLSDDFCCNVDSESEGVNLFLHITRD